MKTPLVAFALAMLLQIRFSRAAGRVPEGSGASTEEATSQASPPHDFFTGSGSVGRQRKGFPLHDAIIASGYLSMPASISLREMLDVLECSSPKREVDAFVEAIPSIIDQALDMASLFGGAGRVIEYSNQTFTVGENYVARMKAVTTSCVLLEPTIGQDSAFDIGPGAYASNIVTSSMEFSPSDVKTAAYNLSMILDADIMELPAAGFYYIPKRYCLDFEGYSRVKDFGPAVDSSLKNTDAVSSAHGLTRTISLGTKDGTMKSLFNRVAWNNNMEFDLSLPNYSALSKLVREAFDDPKVEVLAVIDVMDSPSCDEFFTSMEPSALLALENCITDEAEKVLSSSGADWNTIALFNAVKTVDFLFLILLHWIDEKKDYMKYPVEALEAAKEIDPDDVQTFKDLFTTDFERFVMAYKPAPQFFEKTFTSHRKTSVLQGQMVNPYHDTTSFERDVVLPLDEEDTELHACTFDGESKTDGAAGSALFYRRALQRRIHEFKGAPSTKVSDWAKYNGEWVDDSSAGAPDEVNELVKQLMEANEKYLDQTVEWDDHHNLQPGNMREKKLGKTARWLLMTDWFDSSPLQTLLQDARDSQIYSNTASEAVKVDNPCGKAATDADIFLFVFAMVTAACGGVNTIMFSVHYALHWWSIICCGGRRREKEIMGWRKFIPTYEVLMVLFGVAAFLGLYTPLFLQVILEYEVANFKTSSPGMEANYADHATEVWDRGYPVLVTLTYVESECEEARPLDLALLLVIGFAIGVVINAPYINSGWEGLVRYWKRMKSVGGVVPAKGTTLEDSELLILLPARSSDGASHENTGGNIFQRMHRRRQGLSASGTLEGGLPKYQTRNGLVQSSTKCSNNSAHADVGDNSSSNAVIHGHAKSSNLKSFDNYYTA